MAAPDHRPRRNSNANGTMGTRVPGFHPEDWPQMPEGAARAAFTGLDLMDSWLAASRQMFDLWRTTLREQQDGMLTACRHHIASTASGDLIEEKAPRSLKARSPGSRSPRRRSSNRTAPKRADDGQFAVTRH